MSGTANMTKIQKSDLGFSIQDLLTDLESSRGTFISLTERLNDLNAKDSSTDTRMDGIDDSIAEINSKLNAFGEFGNFIEEFQYDENGNVTKHIVTGDITYTIDYVYADPINGILNYSEKKYTDSAGKQVTIRKDYTYNPTTGNIINVATTTTIV